MQWGGAARGPAIRRAPLGDEDLALPLVRIAAQHQLHPLEGGQHRLILPKHRPTARGPAICGPQPNRTGGRLHALRAWSPLVLLLVLLLQSVWIGICRGAASQARSRHAHISQSERCKPPRTLAHSAYRQVVRVEGRQRVAEAARHTRPSR